MLEKNIEEEIEDQCKVASVSAVRRSQMASPKSSFLAYAFSRKSFFESVTKHLIFQKKKTLICFKSRESPFKSNAKHTLASHLC